MIQVDKRIGSAELAKYLVTLKVPVEVGDLTFGDFCFLGQGPEGLPIPVGIERKALADWVTSFYTGRFFGHQLKGMLLCYQVIYVVVEGLWREDHQTGRVLVYGWDKAKKKKGWIDLEVGGKVVMARELAHQVMTAENKGGVIFKWTGSKVETGKAIDRIYHWWCDKEFDAHRSHLVLKPALADKALLIKPSLCRQVAACLPGVGWVRSGAVALHFKTVHAMVQASEAEWQTVDGIGKTMAQRIVGALRTPGSSGSGLNPALNPE